MTRKKASVTRMQGRPKEPYAAVEKRITERYAEWIFLPPAKRAQFIMDFVESWEDIQRLTPVYQALTSKKVTVDRFRQALTELTAWSGHLAEHLRRLTSLSDREFERYMAHLEANAGETA